MHAIQYNSLSTCCVAYSLQCLTGITVGIKYYHLDAVNEPIDFQRSWIIFPTFLSLVIAALRFDGIWSLWSFLYATESCLYRVAGSLEATLELPSFFRSLLLLLLLSRFSHVRLCGIPLTAAHQAPRFMGFSRQEYWSGVPLPSPISIHKPA